MNTRKYLDLPLGTRFRYKKEDSFNGNNSSVWVKLMDYGHDRTGLIAKWKGSECNTGTHQSICCVTESEEDLESLEVIVVG